MFGKIDICDIMITATIVAFFQLAHDEIPIEFAPEPVKIKEDKTVYKEEKGDFVGTKGDITYTFRANKDLLKEESPEHIYWFKDGELHRDDGPAIEVKRSFVKKWYRHGQLHRDDGPAVIYPSFSVWYRDGKFIGSKVND